MKIKTKESTVVISESIGKVTVLIVEPIDQHAVLVLAHGAGAGMTHRFMEAIAVELANTGVATVRYNFPYMENGKKRPDPPAIAEKTVEKIIEFAHDRYSQTPLFAGGKSFGGRMTSQWLSKQTAPVVKGVIFYGFPLHATGKPSTDRAAHLSNIHIPMLFLQGSRDTLAEPKLIKSVTSSLPTAKLITFDGADHSFNMGKKNIIPELVQISEQWIRDCTI